MRRLGLVGKTVALAADLKSYLIIKSYLKEQIFFI